jgi:hypothetical protein
MFKFWRLAALAVVLIGSALMLTECSNGSNGPGSSSGGVTGTTPGTGY